ncbi:MAG: hypothetical protein AB1641_24770 [Thermodesulfobacteriota bacterium]
MRQGQPEKHYHVLNPRLETAILTFLLIILAFIPQVLASSGGGGGGDTADPSAASTVSSMSVNGQGVSGDQTINTSDRTVTLEVSFVGQPNEFQVCEDRSFKGCSWKNLPFNGRIAVILSEGAGLKKIYFRARYLGRPGPVMVANVNYVPR